MGRIFGIGTVVVDQVVHLPRFPSPDSKTAIDTHREQMGGPVPVALSIAQQLAHSTTFLGRWAADRAGETIEKSLAARGIGYSPSTKMEEGHSGFAQVWVESETGTRTIAYHRGDFPLPGADDLNGSTLAAHDLLLLDGWAPEIALQAARKMKEMGGRVVLDAGSLKPEMEKLFPFADVLIASQNFCQSMWNDPVPDRDTLMSTGVDTIMQTLGAKGCRLHTGDQSYAQAAYPVDVVDSNGAGDAFCGALLHGMLSGWTVEKQLRFASLVAAALCATFGNYCELDTPELLRRLHKTT